MEQLFRNYRGFHLQRFDRVVAGVLVSDDKLGVVTRFDWLGYRGNPERRLRDERGLRVNSPALVGELFEKNQSRFE